MCGTGPANHLQGFVRRGSMKTTQTILIGFVLVAFGVLVGFFLNQEFSLTRAAEESGSYSVLRVDAEQNKLWRMNNRTGEISTCQERDSRLECVKQAKLDSPQQFPLIPTSDKPDPKFDRIMSLFDRIIDSALKDGDAKISAPTEPEKR